MKYLLAVLVLAAGIALYIRIAPSEAAHWHVDPLRMDDPMRSGVLLLPGPEARTYPVSPRALMAALDEVALSQPRVVRLAGSPEERHVTYIARSRLMRFPDYVTVRAVAAEGGAQLAVYSRLRFGAADSGVNRQRLEQWLKVLDARLDMEAGRAGA